MSTNRTSTSRALGSSVLLAGLLLGAVSTASAQDTVESPIPDASAASVPAIDPLASPSFAASPPPDDIVLWPLPESVAVVPPDIPTVSVEPESIDELEIGEPIEHSLGHCGLWSPVDLDGSLWQPVGGTKPDGSAIVEGDDAAIGELINATPGVFVIVAEDRAHFTTATGSILEFLRAPGALSYPLCV
jgi:hypothetical protein